MNKIILTVLALAIVAAAQDTTYKDGTGCGGCGSIYRLYYESGALMFETSSRGGFADGLEKEYYESGALRATVVLVHGKSFGYHKVYHESGSLKFETMMMMMGVPVERKGYYETGAPVL